MDVSAVGAATIDMHLSNTQRDVGIAMVDKVMDLQEVQMAQMIEMMETAVPPSFGHQLNILV